MKTLSSSIIVALGTLLATAGLNASSAEPNAPASPPAAEKEKSREPNPAEPREKTAGTLAETKATEKAIQEHLRPVNRSVMETPPPAPRTETKPESPVAGYVWVPGHWAAVKGDWQWTAGVWSIPATPSSIWIPAKYDAKTKEWSAGYWQPDRPQSYESTAPEKGTDSAPGAPAPAPRTY